MLRHFKCDWKSAGLFSSPYVATKVQDWDGRGSFEKLKHIQIQ
jgi:hypothetical protein